MQSYCKWSQQFCALLWPYSCALDQYTTSTIMDRTQLKFLIGADRSNLLPLSLQTRRLCSFTTIQFQVSSTQCDLNETLRRCSYGAMWWAQSSSALKLSWLSLHSVAFRTTALSQKIGIFLTQIVPLKLSFHARSQTSTTRTSSICQELARSQTSTRCSTSQQCLSWTSLSVTTCLMSFQLSLSSEERECAPACWKTTRNQSKDFGQSS